MKTVRESYVKRLRDNYLLILRTLMHDLIVSIDTDGSFAFVNDAAVKFFGESRKKLIGSHFSDYIHPDDLKRALGALQELIEQKGQVSGFLLRAKSPQGYKTIAWNGLAIFDDAGNYMGAQATGKDLSDLLRVEEELKQSKQHFQSLFDVIVDPIVILDLTGTILEVSQSAEEIFGLSKAGLVGKSFLETKISNVDTKEVMLKNLNRLQQGKYIPPYAIESVSKDGKQVFYEVNPARIKYKGEDAILAIFRNITEQKQAEKKLRASEERFRYFVENAPEAIWIQDLSGTFVDGNKLAEKITGYRRDELIGTSILDANLVPAKYASAVMEAYEANLRGERSGPTELELIRKDGSTVFVEASSIPVQRDGQIEIIGIAREITDRKMAEDALRESEKRFRDLGELLPEIVFETDLEGNLTFANQIAYEKSGYSPEDFAKGMSFINLIVPEDRSRAMNDMVKVLSGTDLGFLEYTVLRKDGSKFPMMIHTTPILRDNKLVGLRGVIIDVTEQKKSEEALKKSEERFRTTLDNMLEGCQIIGYDWKYVYLNDTAAKHGRKPKQKLLGKTILEMYPQIKGTKLLKVLTKCMKEHVPAKLENEFTFSDGKKGWFELSIEPVPEGLFILSIDITDRKEVENALHREREMLEIVTSNINAGLVVVSTDFTVLWINDVLRTYLGDIEGKPCYSTLNQNDDVCQGCGVKEIFDTGKDWVVHEQAVPTPQGDTIWLEVTATAIRNKQGEIVAASEMSLDITERKKTELELKASLQRFRTIFEGATDGITAVKPGAQNFSFVNPRMSEITGYSSEELLKLDIFDLMRQEDLSSAKELYANMLDGKLETARGMPILRKDKSLVYCDVSFKLMKISDQTYFVGFLRDVTEQKIAEDKLRESEQRFKHFLFNAPEAIWVQDISGTFIDGNKMGEELTGYSREELIGKNMLELGLVPVDYIPRVMEAFQDISIGERSGPVELLLQRKDGSTVIAETSIIPVEREGKIEIIGVVLDVTERKKTQEAITKANQLLKRSNEELESYTYVVSHDLKAPLRTIRSFGSFILEDYADKLDETGKDYLNRMVNASSHLDSMIEDLLVLSRVGRKFTDFEKVNLNKLLDEILADLETSIKESKTKIVVDKLPVLFLQRVWIKQVFMNLLSNALKFNESKTPKIEIKYEEKDKEHQFTVKDNGIGIEEKYLQRIFNLFERAPTEKQYDGTGAGLAICKKIVEKFGGKIWVESTLGKGSSFFFTIPKELKQEKEV